MTVQTMTQVTCAECGGSGEVALPGVDTDIKTHRGKLERGWRVYWLVDQLAKGEATKRALSRALGVSVGGINYFAKKHADEIAHRRQELCDELTGLWITEQRNRLAERQQDIDDINTVLARKMRTLEDEENEVDADVNADVNADSVIADIPAWIRVKEAILKDTAEELGQIMPKQVAIDHSGSIATYRIDGIDLSRV